MVKPTPPTSKAAGITLCFNVNSSNDINSHCPGHISEMVSVNSAPPPYSVLNGGANAATVHKLVVGVDFGTTYTGISWVSTEGGHVKILEDVHCVRDWPGPGRDGDFSWKTPSRIAYAKENDNASSNAWGYEVLPRYKSFAWMKLLLDPKQATKYDDPSLGDSEGTGVLSRPAGKSAVDLCADFLAEVGKFAYESLSKRLSVEVLKATPIEFWFTVPAVWSDKAKADTLRAARKAAKQAKLKIHAESQVFLIREPEAAAVATLSSLTQGGSEQQIKANDSIMICDCGGGTVDITTYVITGITPKLAFKELLVGTGGKCGSTYIDREFIKFMEKKFGAAYTNLKWEKRGPASRLMKDFESHKRDFGKSKDAKRFYEMQLYMEDVAESKYYDEDDFMVKIYRDDLKKMFEPVVSKITALLQSQLDAEKAQFGKSTIKTILLVGGFGDSAHLNEVLRKWCQDRGIKLLCPEHPQSAIVRGAALSGLHSIQPTSRRSRLHYGFSVHEAFDPLQHDIRDRFVWEWNQTYRAKNVMRWELCQGDVVDETTNVEWAFYQTIYQNEGARDNRSTVDLYCSGAEEEPRHRSHASIIKLATINLDFSNVDMRNHAYKMVNRRRMCRISCTIRIFFGHRRGVLVFTCIVDGKEIGTTEVNFDGNSNVDAVEGPGGAGGSMAPCAMQ
ncbi:unnamed protein product [Cercospora beticola]|nr:unnamed protein product [Cercospora beticola]